METCPTCGMPVRTFESDEGTCGYEPISEEQRAIIEAVLEGRRSDVLDIVERWLCPECAGTGAVLGGEPAPIMGYACPSCGATGFNTPGLEEVFLPTTKTEEQDLY